MYEISGFENFYAEKIKPSLPQLREECRQMDVWHIVGIASAIFGFLSFLGYQAEVLTGVWASWLFIFFAAGVVFSVYKYTQRNDRFTVDFKKAIIKTIIDDVSPGLVYKPDETVTSREYKTSGLYRYRYDYFDGDDYMEGVIKNVSFHCSELHVQSDYALNQQMTVFKGLFFVVKINERFTGGTYVWPRHRAQLATSRMDEGYRLLPMPRVTNVYSGDAAFDEQFRVCSTWSGQAMEILNPEIRNNILNIGRSMKIALSFSFVAGRCFIGVPLTDNLLEPTDFDPGDKEEIRKYFITIQLIVNIIGQSGLLILQ
jgi:hypothetical protein